ncbi:Coiled-coil domain-containing protein 58 [Orchesella cincta]|uniref:Protein MIX23 n=1 Tax=Orchesella cincta TaxID=48709 RepID=A0A1D2M2P3_ORCCI|nr:Coiled-coil domain-containing protein 58 [Orchesella cincta]
MTMGSMCEDISEFLDTLKRMRKVDDKIVQTLNTTVPTESFSLKVDGHATCKDLFSQIVRTHVEREKSLKQCLSTTSIKVQKLRDERNSAPNDMQLQRNLKREQMKLREMHTQLNVEEVIRGQTLKVYNERCRSYYKPSQDPEQSINLSEAQ